LIISAYFVPSNPLYIGIFFIVCVIAVILASVMSYVWGIVIARPEFATMMTTFRLTNFLMSNIHIFTTILSFIAIFVMFGKGWTGSSR
jgi:hypothetical protein